MRTEVATTLPRARYLPGEPKTFARGSARYTPAGDDYVTKFRRLVRQWRAATLLTSTMRAAVEHPKFQQIVDMGDKIIPLIIQEIKTTPDFLMAALPVLTGEDPVDERDLGNMPAMATAWIEWYATHGRGNGGA